MLTLVTPPATEPLGLADVKAHLRVDGDDEDVLLYGYIGAAREAFEQETGRQLINATYRLMLDGFPRSPIALPKPPLSSVTSVTYLDTAGASQTWDPSDYEVTKSAGPFARAGLLFPAFEETYPDTRRSPNAVTIEFVAGYGSGAGSVPGGIKAALMVMVADMYAHRETQITGTIVYDNKTFRRLVRRYTLPAYA